MVRHEVASKLGLASIFAAAAMMVGTALAEPTSVKVTNNSKPTTCAEEDNVNYIFTADHDVKGYKVASALPAYMPSIVQDYVTPDFENCPNTPPPKAVAGYTPPGMVLYQDDQIMLRGMVDPRFWRPHTATIKVDQLEWPFLDLVQLWKNTPSGFIEFLVFYPQDGYWRLKSLPPRRFRDVSYGSSFLLGPIEDADKRPFVAYKRVTFDWKTLTFHIEFASGGTADVKVTGLGDEATSEISVSFDPALKNGTPFASLRSMYIAPGNFDTEHVVVRAAPGAAPVTTPVMEFKEGQVNDILFSRQTLSKHNISAPDTRFFDFTR